MATIPWIEKYRPIILENVVLSEHIYNSLKCFMTNKNFQHLLLHGPSGTGKTSTIMACANELYGSDIHAMVMELNASDDRGIEVVRTKIKQFVKTDNVCGSKLFKLVILDETDAMTDDAQAILRKVIEKYINNARFCLICNYVHKISPALQSRCICFKFKPLTHTMLMKRLNYIVSQENINISNDGYNAILKYSNGDMRKAINTLQSCYMAYKQINEINIQKILGIPSNEQIYNVLETLANKPLSESFDFVLYLHKILGITLSDIISECHEVLINSVINGNQIFTFNVTNIGKIIKELGVIEYNMALCTHETIQIGAFVSAFYN